MLDEIARTWKGIVKVAKVNVMKNAEIAQKFSIKGVPTLILLRNGEIIGQTAGALPYEQVDAFLKRHITLTP